MKNNVLGFIVYFVATVLLSEKVGVLLLAIKENSDRCHYYNGKWNKTDLAIGGAAIILGTTARLLINALL